MKLKFKAEKKDVTIFVVFMIALFYLIALAVVNIMAFLNEDVNFTLIHLKLLQLIIYQLLYFSF